MQIKKPPLWEGPNLHQALKVCWAAQRAQEENLIIGAIDKWLKLVFLTISFYGHV